MSAHDNIALARRYFEAHVKHGSRALIDILAALDQAVPNAADSLQQIRASVSDLRFTIHAIVARGDQVEIFATSEINVPGSPNTESPVQRIRISEQHTLCVAEDQIISHYVDHEIHIDVWDTHQGWLPVIPPGTPPRSPLH